jgi:hypothetical protein
MFCARKIGRKAFPKCEVRMMRLPGLLIAGCLGAIAADLPVREVILYKHGVAYFERSGELKPGDTARLDFKSADMNDVLKSLTISDRSGGKVAGVRYDASEALEKRLEDFPFAVGDQSSLSTFLDALKGARVELKIGQETLAGAIVSSRPVKADEKDARSNVEMLVLLLDSGEIRNLYLSAASWVRLTDPKLQTLFKDYLGVLSQSRSKDKRSIYIDASGAGARQLSASYMTPAAVWKSSYRLLFGSAGEPTLEGWAIVDNTSGEDWSGVKLSVVSGRPISFITELYQPRYVNRPRAELAENNAVAPVVFEGAIASENKGGPAPPPAPRAMAPAPAQGRAVGAGSLMLGPSVVTRESAIASTAEGREAGDLFEYSFANPVTVKQGESAMLPFLQQKVTTRKLLIYMDSFGLHPMNAAEITNSTGKTLDGGPITVYDAGSYAGEALVETLKAGDKRLISYGVDLGTRVTTAFDSSKQTVREVHLSRGGLTSRIASEETKTYTIRNVDVKAKTVIIEYPVRYGYKLLDLKPLETTSNAYRFEVKLGPNATEKFPVREERVYDQTTNISNMTPDSIIAFIQGKPISAAARAQLQQIAQKKSEIVQNDVAATGVASDIANITQDEERQRANIQSLSAVAGQQDQVQQYARGLAASESKLATLGDQQKDLRRKRAALESELNSLIEKMEF